MKKKKTTLNDIAEELDITASTVSRALQDHPRISTATKKSVLKMAKKLNYQPNHIAAALRKGKSNVIGIIIPTADRNFFASIIRGVEEVANKAKYNVIICQSNDSLEKEKANINALLKSQVDGILASYAKETTNFDHYQEVLDRGIPLIMFDRAQESLDVGSVVIDDYLGAFKATEHLIEEGCKNIVHYTGPQNLNIYSERKRGYIDALKQHNLPIREDWILESNMEFDAGQELGKRIAEWETLPDGIFSASDYAAMGTIKIFNQYGIEIPQQVAIVGFSNESFTSFIDPGLTSVDQHSKEIGQVAAELFLSKIQNSNSKMTSSKMVLNPDLIIRESSLHTSAEKLSAD